MSTTTEEFRLFARQDWAGPEANQFDTIPPEGRPNGFGQLVVCDWTLHEGPERDARTVGRVQGQIMKVSRVNTNVTNIWQHTCTIVITDDPRFAGSTLAVMGLFELGTNIQWAIVGGTGEFTSAQGAVDLRVVSEDGNTKRRVIEFNFVVTIPVPTTRAART